jgi:hypothetical protein
MTPDTLKVIGEKLFGAWGWQTKLAKALRVDGSTVRRWISGVSVIPGPAEVALELLLLAHEGKQAKPPRQKKQTAAMALK